MRIIRQLLFVWFFVTLLVLRGFGQIQHLRTPPLWSDFKYNSPEEKEYWDKLPDWSSDKRELFRILPFTGKFNSLGELIDSNSSEGFNGYVKFRSANNRTIQHYVDGRLVRSKSWYINGQEKADKNYKRGIAPPTLDGLQITWYENGRMKIEKNYRNGKPDGNWTEWYEGGQISLRAAWKNGKPDGNWTEWYEDGQMSIRAAWKNGNPDGNWTEWYEGGQISLRAAWKSGKPNGNWTEWYENGQKKVADNYVDGKQDGLQITWHKNGQKESIASFKDGFEDGQPFYRWDENGVQEYSPFGRNLTIPPRHWITQSLCSPISCSSCESYKCWVYHNKIKLSFPHSGIP